MRGRFEGFLKDGRIVLIGAFLFFGIFLSGTMLSAQEFSEKVMQMIERKCEDGGEDVDGLVSYLEYLMQNPVNLNNASREMLETVPFMTPFMVENLIDYRNEYGSMISWAELSLLHGFDENTVNEIKAFAFLGQSNAAERDSYVGEEKKDSGAGRSVFNRIKNRMILRSRIKFVRDDGKRNENRKAGKNESGGKGLPFSLYAKYRMDCGSKGHVGFTLESDAGERRLPDFYSFYLHVSDIPLSRTGFANIRSIVAGDYSLCFGQGVVLWNSFTLSGISSPSSLVKSGGKIRPYTSSNENRYCRGVAMTLDVGGHIETSLFFSASKLDAKVEGDYFYSPPRSLLHDDKKSLAKKDALTEYLFGGNFTFRYNRLKVGVTALGYKYDKRDGRKLNYYNKYLKYDGLWCNFSSDFLYSYNGMRMFGEFALDKKGAFGGLAGLIVPVNSFMEFSMLGRYYDVTFIANHSGAVSVSSHCNNEIGATAIFKWSPLRTLTFNLSAEYTRHPYSRYGVKGPSDKLNVAFDSDWNIGKRHLLSFRGRYEIDDGKKLSRFRLRTGYVFESLTGFSTVTRLETSFIGESSPGWLCYEELTYKSPAGKFVCALRGTIFFIDEWNSRIYCYEHDLPNSFSVPAYYGRGAGLYAIITCKPAEWVGISVKWSGNLLSDRSKSSMKLGLYINLLF